MIDLKQIIITGGLLGAGGTIVYQLRQLPEKLYKHLRDRLIYTVKVYQMDELFDIMEEWLSKNYQAVYRDVEASVQHREPPAYPGGNSWKKEVIFRQEEAMFVMRWKSKRIIVSKGKEKFDKASTLKEVFFRHYTLKGFKAKEEINDFLKHITALYFKSRETNSIRIYSNTIWGEWNCVNDNQVKSFDQVVLNKEEKNEIIQDLESFTSSLAWYMKRGIPYKRGYCFHGPPGNGKTSIAMAIAHHLKRDVYILNLNCLDNDSQLIKAFGNTPKGTMLLIEDMDRVFSGRDSVDTKVSFSTLLNCMDGAMFREGTILVVTTNHLEKLDPALIREGRTDMMKEIKNPTRDLIKEYIEKFFEEKIMVDIPDMGYSMAKVQEMCLRFKDDLPGLLSDLKKLKLKLA